MIKFTFLFNAIYEWNLKRYNMIKNKRVKLVS